MTDHALADRIERGQSAGDLVEADRKLVVAALRAHPATTDHAQTMLADELEAWPATGRGDGLDAAVVGRLMKKAAAALRSPAIGTPDDAREALKHALVRFECLSDQFEEAGDWASWAMASVDADRMKAAIAAAPREQEAKPVAWRIRIREGYKTYYTYTERLPFEPDEDCKITILGEPEPLYAAPPSDSPGSADYVPIIGKGVDALDRREGIILPGSAHQPQGSDARATELLPCPLCNSADIQPGICYMGDSNERESAARCATCGCRATRKAWQNRTPPAPVREADPTQKQRVAMMRARSAAPVRAAAEPIAPIGFDETEEQYIARLEAEIDCLRAAAEPGEMRELISNAIMRVVSSRDDLGYTHFIEIRDAIYAALSPASANEGSGR